MPLIACCMLLVVHADSPELPLAKDPVADKGDLARSIANLGADEFNLRRAAFMDIWRYGKAALPAIQESRKSTNLQVAEASAALENLLTLEVSFGELDSDAIELLVNPSAEQLIRLCERRNWRLAERLVASKASLVEEFRSPAGAYYANRIVETALAQADPHLAWPIIRIVTSPSNSGYAGSNLGLWLAQHLELPYEVGDNEEWKALQLYYRGDASGALQQNISEALRSKIVTRDGRWEALKSPEFQAAFFDGNTSVSTQAAQAVLLEFSGNRRAAEFAWSKLLQSPEDKGKASDDGTTLSHAQTVRAIELLDASSPADEQQLFLALLLAGRVRAAEQYLEQTDSLAAFDFYAAGNDYQSAFRLIDLAPDLSNFDSWLQSRKTLIEKEIATSPDQSTTFSQSAQLCNIFTSLGFREEARELLDILATIAGHSKSGASLWAGRGSIISWMGRAEQRSLCLDVLEQRLRLLPAPMQQEMLRSLFPEFLFSSPALLRTAPSVLASDGTPLSPLRVLDRLHAWDHQFFAERAGATAMADWLVSTHRELLSRQSAVRQPAMLVAQLAELAELAVGCEMPDLALKFSDVDLRDLGGSELAPKPHWIVAAKIHLSRGEGKKAAELLSAVRNEKNSANDQTALAAEIESLLLAGEYEQAVLLERSRWLRPLSLTQFYQGMAYSQVVDAFVDQAKFSYAKDYAELAFRLSDFASMDTYWAASDLSQIHEELGDLAASADALRAPLVEALQANSDIVRFLFERGLYNSMRYAAQKERVHRAAACIARGEIEEAQHHMAVGKQLQPQDIEMVVQCYPRLVAADRQDLADELFQSYETSMLGQIETWHHDSTALNNLAWMYSQCDRKLAEAYELSKKAVELAPTSSTFLDTLAEVHYRSNRVSEALQIMQRCVQLDPRERHYRQNLVRFNSSAK